MKTSPSLRVRFLNACNRSRFSLVVTQSLLAVTCFSASASRLSAATINGLVDDRQVSSTGALTDGTPMLSGYSGTTAMNAVVVFQLPALPAGKEFSAASLKLYLQGKTGTPSFNADLYGVGVSSSPTVTAGNYYSGAFDSSAVLLQNDLLMPSFTSGTIISNPSALTDFLNAAYASGAGAGQYVFFRVNPDVSGLNNFTRYNLYSADAPGGSYYWPQLTYSTADAAITWADVPLGGGGYVTGIVSNTTGAAIYCRTDVGGAFRWVPVAGDSAGNGTWVSISDAMVPLGATDAGKLMGVESIATDPSNLNRVYVGAGGRILVSDDQGATWTEIHSGLVMGANAGDTRFYGERLTIDPNNPNVAWYGSIQQGLQKGVKSGSTWSWSQVPATSVPFGAVASGSNAGVTFVICDKNSGSTLTYAGVFDGTSGGTGGVYVTADGTNWTKVSTTSGSFNTPRRAQIASNGTLYVTGGTNGVFKLPRSGSLTSLSALPTGPFYNGVAVDTNNAAGDIVYVADRSSLKLWRSADGGGSWATQASITQTRQEPDGSAAATGYWFGNTSSLLVNPANSSELWAGDFFGVARTRNASALGGSPGSTWYTLQKGQEETVVLDLLNAPTGPRLISALADVGGYRYTNTSVRPTAPNGDLLRNPGSNNTTSLDFSEANNNIWARSWIASAGNGSGAYSTDGGVSWLMFGQVAQATVNSGSAAWETWNLTTYLAAQQAAGATSVTLVIASDNATNITGTPVEFDSSDIADTTLHPRLIINGVTGSPRIPTDDTYVHGSVANVGANFGTAAKLSVSHAYSDTIVNDRQTYLKFDLTGAAPITSATLQLHRIAATAGIQYTVGVFAAANTSWTESTLTWSNRPLTYACGNAARNPFAQPNYKTATGVTLGAGRIAISATDANTLVWVPSGTGNRAYYSRDRGVTWTISTGGPNSEIAGIYTNGTSNGISAQPLAADRTSGLFYMANFTGSGGGGTHQVYTSTDGAAWTLASTLSNGGTFNARTPQLVAAPATTAYPTGGDVWLCDDSDYNKTNNGGLWRSVNSASSWTKISNVGRTTAVSFGKADTAGNYDVYIFGYVGGVKGVYRSKDYGTNWTKLADPTIAQISAIAGDRQIANRVFIGTGGRGTFQGNQ